MSDTHQPYDPAFWQDDPPARLLDALSDLALAKAAVSEVDFPLGHANDALCWKALSHLKDIYIDTNDQHVLGALGQPNLIYRATVLGMRLILFQYKTVAGEGNIIVLPLFNTVLKIIEPPGSFATNSRAAKVE
jgi:hypothetical protein